ncbi:MAG: helix-turn-helix transcriptional regulator [Clostridia bacterium]|jgi:transcriptional regulator with XRE-family HTH domain|nr:helix-turn-helix transcriptional regulator [Clostridia bacterium]
MVNFGEKLRELRTSFGMTQAELASRLRVTKSIVSYYELHERTPSPDVLIKLADIFHVSTDYLLGIEQRKMIDVSGLSEADIKLILMTVESLREKNSSET